MTLFGENLSDLLAADQVVAYAIPFFVLFILLEAWLHYREHRKLYDLRDGASSIGMGLGSLVFDIAAKTIGFLLFFWVYQYRVFDLGWAWWVWVIGFFADDFTFYWHHRLCHEVRLFWAAHVNHHSSRNLNLAVALRQSWGEVFHKYPLWIWMPLLGFHPLMVMMLMSANLVYQFFTHTEQVRRLGPLEWFFNTPSHHRVHHARNITYLDRNHAGVLIIWDRLFGTYQPEQDEEPVEYGIRGDHPSNNLFDIAFHEYRALFQDVRGAHSFREALGYLFGPPGWSPNGERQTTRQLRAASQKIN